jgi:ribosomal protein L37AE/L43A
VSCPASPNCPYCDDDGEHERRAEEADAEALLEAHMRDPEEDDQPPFNDDGECSFCRSDRIEHLPQGVVCMNCGSRLFSALAEPSTGRLDPYNSGAPDA